MRKLVLITALGTAIVLQSVTALAGKQVYPGSMCVRWNQNESVPVLNGSRIYNPSSTQEMHVDCPILHQNFDPNTGNNLDDADIGVIDTNTTRNASCWLTALYQINSTLYGTTGGTRGTAGFGSHEQNLDFNGTGRHAENWYYIGCSIPRAENGQQSGITYFSGQD